jgi:hypothetical protein
MFFLSFVFKAKMPAPQKQNARRAASISQITVGESGKLHPPQLNEKP